MINWKLTLHKLFFMHEWEEIDQRDISWLTPGYEQPTEFTRTYVLQCKTCGTLKRKKIKL